MGGEIEQLLGLGQQLPGGKGHVRGRDVALHHEGHGFGAAVMLQVHVEPAHADEHADQPLVVRSATQLDLQLERELLGRRWFTTRRTGVASMPE